MFSPLLSTVEEGAVTLDIPAVAPHVGDAIGEKPGEMAPGDYVILGKVFERKNTRQIAEELGISKATVRKVTHSEVFRTYVSLVEERMLERISAGEFGALAIAKAETVGAMKRVVGMSKSSDDERVKLNANLEILKLGGIQPPKPAVIESPERLIDLMTAEELDAFAREGTFPERLGDQLARVASSVLKKAEAQRFQVEVVDGLLEDADEPAHLSNRKERRRAVVEELPADDVPDDVDEEGVHGEG